MDKMVELRKKGLSCKRIAQELTNLKLPTPWGRAWAGSTVYYNLARVGALAIDGNTHCAEKRTSPEAEALIRKLSGEGLSGGRICQQLNAQGILTAHGGKWSNAQMWAFRNRHGMLMKKAPRRWGSEGPPQELVQLMVDLHKEGLSCVAIGHHLDEQNILPCKADKWNFGSIARILSTADRNRLHLVA